MVKKIIKTNPNLIELINKLNKQSKSEDAAILLIDFQGQIEELQK